MPPRPLPGIRTSARSATPAITSMSAKWPALLSATRAISKAATKGVFHRNTASRKISRLTLAVRKLGATG